MQKIILASQSPRRKQLLEWAEVPFDILVKETDETYPENLTIEEIAIHIARNKALAIRNQLLQQPLEGSKTLKGFTSKPILAADTIVVLEDKIIGKPKDRADAIDILTSLSGTQHVVVTGVVILHNEKEIAFAETTEVNFHELSLAQIEFYIDNYKPYDKAGAYAIQEWIGVVGIKSVVGDFYNVMGLPVSRVVKALQNL
jgi:septum formation protein